MDRSRIMSRSRIEPQKVIVIFFGICTGFVLWLAFDFPSKDEAENLLKSDSDWLEEEDNFQSFYTFETSKKILFYTPRYGQKDWNFGTGNKPFENAVCRQQNCYLTSNRSLLQDLSQFDAVLFHMSAIHNEAFFNTLPEIRGPNQKYVFSVAAPPKNGQFSFQDKMKDLFNWTMTYHSKSTIHTPCARIVNLDSTRVDLETKISIGYAPNTWSKRPDAKFFSWNRTNLVAWHVDDCNEERTHREDYVSYLENYIPVDIYGKCGNLQCPTDLPKGENCLQFLAKKYKFLLAFESDLCTDFASFKWYSIMDQPTTVAVVMGAADYSRLAPPKSYINVADFKSAKELANYLLFLNAHDDEYVKYFAWKYEWRVDYRAPICKLCELLHEQVTTTSVDLEYIANTAGCRSGQEYPWMIQSMADEIEERNKEAEEKLLKERQVMAKRLKSRGKNRHTK